MTKPVLQDVIQIGDKNYAAMQEHDGSWCFLEFDHEPDLLHSPLLPPRDTPIFGIEVLDDDGKEREP